MHNKPNTETPRLQLRKCLFLRQARDETGEQVCLPEGKGVGMAIGQTWGKGEGISVLCCYICVTCFCTFKSGGP